MVKTTGKYICESKIVSVHFYSCPQAKLFRKFLSLPSTQKEVTSSSRTGFLKIYFFPAERAGEDYGVEKNTIIKPTRALPPSLQPLHFLFVLLCHNLASSMLKCEGL